MTEFRFRYTAIRVHRLEESVRFYTELLGMALAYRGPVASTSGEVALLRSPDGAHELELNYYGSEGPFQAPFHTGDELDHLAFSVEDVFRATEELRARGVTVKVEPPGPNGIPKSFVLDPNGIWIELIPRRPDDAPSTT